ncbi:MAG: hypothetical protein KatS3mg091_818 [Patescibacteria group bacterium]|nr:MAG: hypothetical protein KatS3mg091_818 [Patescibacteria group bacterium]
MRNRTYYIKTFGCQQNLADSERIAKAFESRGFKPASDINSANYVVINTCMVRQSAENRVYGLVNNLSKIKKLKQKNKEFFKIIVTGCMVGLAFRDKTGKYLQRLKTIMPAVDEFMPIEEVGFDNEPLRQDDQKAWVPISNGCNNFCTFCVVPFTRGREISRPYLDIIDECLDLKNKGYKQVVLLGQNVNSYGADLIMGENNVQVMRDFGKNYFETKNNSDFKHFTYNGKKIKPVYVKHLGRLRIPTLFPFLLEEVAKIGFEQVDFISSNPWDFSDELIDVIARNKNITRTIHLPLQSGDDEVLKKMNRWYTSEDYINLIKKIRKKVPEAEFTTDIIVGFCGETDEQFENTVRVAKAVGFSKAYIAMYSQRPFTAAVKVMQDDVPFEEKKKRWLILDKLINHRFRGDQTAN